ncbi:unnamed protein product [Nezara viridula]|uniref:Neuropeptide n=1 Tax=Nezara viridula TaxID=85310 RepID=A0A9P0E6I7_NEZVI|nr:unnamed protein product [Nezara viridula]
MVTFVSISLLFIHSIINDWLTNNTPYTPEVRHDKIVIVIYQDSSKLSTVGKTMHYIYVLGFTLLLQQAHGSWLENRIEQMTSPLLEPINNLNDEIQATVAELEAKQAELEKQKIYLLAKLKTTPEQCLNKNLLAHANLYSQWNLEGCLDLAGDWKDGVLFGMKFAIHSYNITTEIWSSVSTAMNCSEMSFFKVLPCYYKSIKSLKDEISYLKEKIAPLIAEGKKIVLNMRKDFNYCLGIPQTMQYRIERNIGNCVRNGPQTELEDPQRSYQELFQ